MALSTLSSRNHRTNSRSPHAADIKAQQNLLATELERLATRYATTKPEVKRTGAGHQWIVRLCIGKTYFYDIGRWFKICTATKRHKCTPCPIWLTNHLSDDQLEALELIWAKHDRLGKKYGKKRAPEELIDAVDRAFGNPDVTPEQDQERESSTRPHHAASPIPRHVPVEIIDLEVIDLTADD
ncbi:hypothetical protein K443DRAFT_13615 [Laccaria amethystina LaAM-08-1]|uniref:Uncharacterized protein n=1 Tax=Laccaria amethystina LaAM-08-1 TaxID=1095629 RepID=A0A0C9WV03_9AGAR|nr:hypothetical protein K443DRAFT_13615 [Laccaria amethystina LaAM-08-1]